MMKQIPVQNQHKRFWWLLGLLLLLIMTRYALQVNLPRVVFLVVIGLMALLGDRDEILALCICIIPMHESIDFFYSLAITLVIYIFKYHRQLHFQTDIALIFLVILWELAHCFMQSFSIVDFLSRILPFIVLAVVMASETDKLDYAFIVRAFAWATLGISIVLFVRVLYFSNFNFLRAVAGLQRMGLDLQSSIEDISVDGGVVNPNTLGIIAVLASTGLMQLRSKKISKKSDMILMCVILVFAALGTSRTYLACLAMMILLLIFAERGGMAKKLRLLGVLCVAVAAAVTAMALIFPDTFAYFVSRFAVSDITTGRDRTMVIYHEFIVNNPRVMFFGIGLQNFGNRLVEVYRVSSSVPHNSVQEIIVAWGIPGIVLFTAVILSMFHSASERNRNIALINWIPLIIILFKGMAGQMITSAYTMLAFSFSFISLCTNMNQDETGMNTNGSNQVG